MIATALPEDGRKEAWESKDKGKRKTRTEEGVDSDGRKGVRKKRQSRSDVNEEE